MMKLSKGVLGLKFMRKTREQIVKENTEKKHREHFKVEPDSKSSSLVQAKTELGSQSKLEPSSECKIIVCPSYLHCERFNYARQSYGGMNPSVEENVRKGYWTMEYEIPGDDLLEVKKDEEEFFDVKQEPMDDMEDGELESNSEEEDKKDINGPVFGSIIATIGRKFNRKAKRQNKVEQETKNNNNRRNRKRPHEDPQDRHDEAAIPNKKRKKGFWKKNKQKKNN